MTRFRRADNYIMVFSPAYEKHHPFFLGFTVTPPVLVQSEISVPIEELAEYYGIDPAELNGRPQDDT